MKHEFTAIIEGADGWYSACCPEIPEASGQGRTRDEARTSLEESISVILTCRRDAALRGLPLGAQTDTVTID